MRVHVVLLLALMGIITITAARADSIDDLVYSKIARDNGQVCHPRPDPDEGTLWDRRRAHEIAEHAPDNGITLHIIIEGYEYDGED